MQMDCALDLLRRLPPQKIEQALQGVIALAPDLCTELLGAVDQPLKRVMDEEVGKDYLLCDYNRDGDSFRSPWTNKYFPALDDGTYPTDKLRKLEVEANSAFQHYKDLYYEGGTSSVYLWDNEGGFAAAILMKKDVALPHANGCWDSINVFEVQDRGTSTYKLTSTVMLWLQTHKEGSGYFNLGGSLTRLSEKEATQNESWMSPEACHVANMGRMVEDMENQMRASLNAVYFSNTRNVIDTLRSINNLEEEKKMREMAQEVYSELQSGGKQA
ncbi:hypothetical protein Ciccas_000099 [Cichlidogyrus casuarinus]|uniref:F-actin-capping protein subunit beta n=1 Tax=Cichlidogyrus casuarinus TaxID=1844966 RepID=A0ABD2QRC5_9PLAT